MNSLNVAIIAGHRKGNQGAYGNLGVSEYKMWVSFGKELVSYLNKIAGVNAKFYKRRNKKGYTSNMVELHKRLDADKTDIAIELHFNGSSNKKVKGFETLCYGNSKKSVKLAKMINDRLEEFYKIAFGNDMPNRGVKKIYNSKQRGYQFLKRGKSKCLLTEPFFASHQDRFIKGTLGYEALMSAYIDFINDVVQGERE